ncbi:MAG: hypothetical protein E6G95_13650 [Alphaproteobacteria bacterium]|nr:MAG: hypothetical protein E6G95_13650 [Alphaproteobacteria bacterium]
MAEYVLILILSTQAAPSSPITVGNTYFATEAACARALKAITSNQNAGYSMHLAECHSTGFVRSDPK